MKENHKRIDAILTTVNYASESIYRILLNRNIHAGKSQKNNCNFDDHQPNCAKERMTIHATNAKLKVRLYLIAPDLRQNC